MMTVLVCLQDGRTCVHLACRGGNVEAVKYLLERGGEEMLMTTDKVHAIDIYIYTYIYMYICIYIYIYIYTCTYTYCWRI